MARIGLLASSLISADFPKTTEELSARITYFHMGKTDLDIDNIIKPILDSFTGVLYSDDSQIGEVNSKRIDLNESYTIMNSTTSLTQQLTKDIEFVYFELFNYNPNF